MTSQNQPKKIERWLERIKEYKSYSTFNLDLSKAALLVLDMQNYFLRKDSHAFVPSSKAIIPQITKIIRKMGDLDRPIIFTRHVSNNDEKSLMSKFWKDNIEIDHPKSEIISELKTKGIILIKREYSAFENTNLKNILLQDKIEQLIITGVMSHLCCETTVRHAFMLGFKPFFIIDANATYNEELHLGTIRNIAHGFGVCLSSEAILDWKSKK